MIKRSISIVFVPPKSFLKNKINSCNSTTFLILKDHLFCIWDHCNLNLVNDCNRNWEKYILTYIYFFGTFNKYLNIFSRIVFNFKDRAVLNQQLLFLYLWLMNFSLFHHFIQHMLRKCYHSIFHPNSIDYILSFSCIILYKL